jgi:replicative DNA helicase
LIITEIDNNRKIHRAMISLRQLDCVLLNAQLQRQGDWEWVGGAVRLAELYQAGKDTNSSFLQDYVKIIKEHALRRKYS